MGESWEWECMNVPAGEFEVYMFVYVHIRDKRVVIGNLCVRLTRAGGGVCGVVTSNMPWGKAISQ